MPGGWGFSIARSCPDVAAPGDGRTPGGSWGWGKGFELENSGLVTQAQAEVLAIVAYLQPVSRPEVARIRGVASDSAVASLTERGMIEERSRTQFGAVTYGTTPLFEKLFGLSGLDALPGAAQFDPTPEDERELRERLLKAGEQRV